MYFTNWVFGQKSGLNFSTNGVTAFTASSMNAPEGCASISSGNGNLLCYSDGTKLWDSVGTLKISGLTGNTSSTQSALFVPRPGHPALFYLFTSDGSSGTNNHLNGIGFSVWTWGSSPLSSLMTMPPTNGYSGTERLAAVRHANKADFWILTVVQNTANGNTGLLPGLLRVLRVTSTGVNYVGDQPLNRVVGDIGQIKASTSGNHIAIADMCSGRVLLYPFNNSTGQINVAGVTDILAKDPLNGTNEYPYGVEFAWNGRLLYYSTLFPLAVPTSPLADGHIFQYFPSTGAHSLIGTRQNVPPTVNQIASLQLGADRRIYFTQGDENALGVIPNPDTPGVACGFTLNAVPLAPGTNCRFGLPNVISGLL